jgi:hypothetical protein
MECRDVRELAEAFVSEQLLVETTQAIATHLDGCLSCRAEVEALRRLRRATQSAFARSPELRARPDFAADMRARLAARAGRQMAGRRSGPTWLALAASALLVVGAGIGLRTWSTASLSALLHTAVGDHRFCALTFKLPEHPIGLEEAARRYGRVYGLLETVEPSKTTLSGGPLRIIERHSCVWDGQRFAHLVLRYKDENISLLVSDDPRSSLARWAARPGSIPMKPDVSHADGFRVATFGGPGHLVFVVSSLGEADVQEVAQAIVEPVTRAITGA